MDKNVLIEVQSSDDFGDVDIPMTSRTILIPLFVLTQTACSPRQVSADGTHVTA